MTVTNNLFSKRETEYAYAPATIFIPFLIFEVSRSLEGGKDPMEKDLQFRNALAHRLYEI